MLSAVLAGGKDVIVNFPQQSNWTGSVAEMEPVSAASSASYGCVSHRWLFFCSRFTLDYYFMLDDLVSH